MTQKRAPAERANLVGLLVGLVSILSVCLTAFNVYLFVWICSALNAGQSLPNSALSLLDRLELLGDSAGRIKLDGRLITRRPFSVDEIRQDHLGGSESSLRLTSANKITFRAANQSSSFSISSQRNSLEFPTGLLISSRPDGPSEIQCEPAGPNTTSSGENSCRLRAKQMKLTNPTGVDLSNVKSIQTNRVRTRRLHSSLQKLQLLAGVGATFRSLEDELQLQALDLVSIGRRHSAESTVSPMRTCPSRLVTTQASTH